MLEGLRTQGFREPEQLVVMVRATGGDPARLAPLFAELVDNKIDVLLPMGGLTLTLAAAAAAANIPIVTFDFELDPVESGLLKSLAHPGGNVTGIFLDLPEISTAWLELLKQAVPSLVRIVVLWDPTMPAMAQHKAVLKAAQSLNITIDVIEVRTSADLEAVFETASARRPDGLLMLTAPLFSIYSKHIAELTLKHRLPAISMFSNFARAGGLMAYGPNLEELYREVGVMTGKILKGTKPTDLPAERPARFELVVNLKAAKALDLNISNLVLARADEVIE
jgi:putative tryptophan/tyrosine transport system substrate-binding protein